MLGVAHCQNAVRKARAFPSVPVDLRRPAYTGRMAGEEGRGERRQNKAAKEMGEGRSGTGRELVW